MITNVKKLGEWGKDEIMKTETPNHQTKYVNSNTETPMDSKTLEERRSLYWSQTCKFYLQRKYWREQESTNCSFLHSIIRQNYRCFKEKYIPEKRGKSSAKKKYNAVRFSNAMRNATAEQEDFFVYGTKDCAAGDMTTSSATRESCPTLCMNTTMNRHGMATPNACTVAMPIYLLNIGTCCITVTIAELISWMTLL